MSALAGLGLWSSDRTVASADSAEKGAAYAASASSVMVQSTTLPRVELGEAGDISTEARTEMAIAYAPVGLGYRTHGAEVSLPGLSLVKLYIAQYVAEHGSGEDRVEAMRMVSRSDDAVAAKLYAKYPDSIDSIARQYGLGATYGGNVWGVSQTSAADVVRFVSQLRATDPDSIVLEGMRQWSRLAADGYRQDFGLATLPGVEGAKLGWANGRGWHSSVVFGPGYVMAAITLGGKKEHTMDVAEALAGIEYADLAGSPAGGTKKPATTEAVAGVSGARG
nr:hypothetical protein [Corynebacterium lactis]